MKIKAFLVAVFVSLPLIANAEKTVVSFYADIALAKYEDSLITAKELLKSVNLFLKTPNEMTLMDSRNAWLKSRIPYQQSEVYRFGNAIVDDWEGKVNAWPLDEGLIDYVAGDYDSPENDFSNLNVIKNPIIKIEGSTIDASVITADLLSNFLQEAGGNEANVATGYHAIEFLLWGQDNNGNEKGSGNRLYTDFDVNNCSNANCDRRREYLRVVTELLVTDLEEMVKNWQPNGKARKELIDGNGLKSMITGMGSLSYGELAGERMQLGLMLHDPEEEHDCFSDNTHNSHYYDALGVKNVYLGEYMRIDGTKISGPSLANLIMKKDKELNKNLTEALQNTLNKMSTLVKTAEQGLAYDQMIAENNELGNKIVQEAINALINQTKYIEKAAVVLNINNVELAGSDSLDNPNAVFE